MIPTAWLITLFTLFTLLLAPLVARAEEKEEKISKDQVPAAVLHAVTKKYAGAALSGFEKAEEGGKISYEVAIQQGSEKMDVELTPDGKITAEEKKIPPASLPAAITEAIKGSKFKSWKITGAERVIKDEKADAPFFEVALKNGGQKTELLFDEGGALVKTR